MKLVQAGKRIIFRLALLALIVYCCKGFLYRNLVNYREINQRALIKIHHEAIQQDLEHWFNTHKSATLEQILDFAASYSSRQVAYTFGKCSTDPNKIILTDKQTNCIGYSAALHSVVSCLLEKKGWSSRVKSEHKVGQLYLLNINMHQFFKDPAFKDHDYNVITDRQNGKKYAIDPTIYSNFGIESVTEP